MSKNIENLIISIVTVVFNGKNEISRTIDSVLKQSYKNVQYIIIDGGSNDGTIEIIKNNASNIDIFISEPDKGIYDAMNKGMALANGDYLIFMNAGDTFYNPDVISNIFDKTEIHKFDLIFGKSISFYKNIEKVRYRDFRLSNKNWYFNWMPNHQAVFISRKIFRSHKFNLEHKLNSDTIFLRKVFGLYSYKYVDQIVSRFEIGGSSNYYKNFKGFLLILKESYRLRGLTSSTFSHVLKYLLQKVFPKDMYLKLYLKYIVKE